MGDLARYKWVLFGMSRTGRTKGTVCFEQDAASIAPRFQLVLGVEGVEFNLKTPTGKLT